MNQVISLLLTLSVTTSAILLTQICLASGFAGIGLLFRRSFGLRVLTLDDCLTAFWIGWSIALLFFLVWNFFLPAGGGGALAIALGVGIIGLIASRLDLRGVFREGEWRPGARLVVLIVLTGLWLADQCLGALRSWDTSLYHLQGVKWAATYPTIPGLANLFGPMGFNNASLVYDAVLDFGPWAGRSNHIANGLLVLPLLIQTLVAAGRFASSGPWGRRVSDLFTLLLLAPVAYLAHDEWVASFVTDLPLNIVSMVAVVTFLNQLVDRDASQGERDYGLVALVVLVSAAVILKMNAAVFAVVVGPLATVLWLRSRPPLPGTLRTLAWCGTVALVFAGVWITRSVILNGYPFFPAPLGALPVDWRVPLEHAQAEYDYIIYSALEFAWTRYPGWVVHLFRVPFEVVVPLGIAFLGFGAWLGLRSRVSESVRAATSKAWWLALPIVIAIAAWLLVAPDPRYITAMTWSLAALCLTQVFRIGTAESWLTTRRWLILALGIGLMPTLAMPLIRAQELGGPANPLVAIARENLSLPGSDHGLWSNAGAAVLTLYTTASGLVVNVPRGRCWDAPLPCTPNPAPNLQLRVPGRIDHGFRVVGDWQMINWPEPWRPSYLAEWRARHPSSTAGSAVHP